MNYQIFYSLLVLMNRATNSAVVPTTAAALSSCPSSCECSLREIQCSDQGFSDVPNIEEGVELVAWLDVSKNNVELLLNNTFKQYPNLKTIDVSGNQITSIEVGAFHGVDYVETVDLSENIIMFIHLDTFAENPNLEMVNLSGNPLMKLSSHVPILKTPTIKYLDLSFCQLTSLTPDMLKGMPQLKKLNINNNELTCFAYENVQLLESLVEIVLDHNRWSCDDCRLLNVLHVLALRNHDSNEVHAQVTCLDSNGDSKLMLSALNELRSCNIEVDDATIELIVTERNINDGTWFYLQHHMFSLHTIFAASFMLTVIVVCTALCMTFIWKRNTTQNGVSYNDQSQMKSKNLMLAFSGPLHEYGSQVPLLRSASTPNEGPSSPSEGLPPTEWTTTVVESDQTSSLYYDFIMNRQSSEHIYDTIGKIDV